MSESNAPPPDPPGQLSGRTSAQRPGPDLARAALDAARSASRIGASQKGGTVEQARWRRVAGQARPGWTGSGADRRDPQPFGSLIAGLVSDRGWERRSAEGSVLGRWEHLVGEGIAAHCSPESLHGGALVVTAESTAWATQLRLLTPRILQRLRTELGPDVVTTIRVHGPAAPSWQKGPRSVRGRGPRDTYG